MFRLFSKIIGSFNMKYPIENLKMMNEIIESENITHQERIKLTESLVSSKIMQQIVILMNKNQYNLERLIHGYIICEASNINVPVVIINLICKQCNNNIDFQTDDLLQMLCINLLSVVSCIPQTKMCLKLLDIPCLMQTLIQKLITGNSFYYMKTNIIFILCNLANTLKKNGNKYIIKDLICKRTGLHALVSCSTQLIKELYQDENKDFNLPYTKRNWNKTDWILAEIIRMYINLDVVSYFEEMDGKMKIQVIELLSILHTCRHFCYQEFLIFIIYKMSKSIGEFETYSNTAMYDSGLINQCISFLQNTSKNNQGAFYSMSCILNCMEKGPGVVKKFEIEKLIDDGLINILLKVMNSDDKYYQYDVSGIKIKSIVIDIFNIMIMDFCLIDVLVETNLLQSITHNVIYMYSNFNYFDDKIEDKRRKRRKENLNKFIRLICNCVLNRTRKSGNYFANAMFLKFMINQMISDKVDKKNSEWLLMCIRIIRNQLKGKYRMNVIVELTDNVI